ncbi:MAG: 3-dehydroquinate synthase [archaeon]
MTQITKDIFLIKQKPIKTEIFFGEDLFGELAKYLTKQKASKYVIITDSKVGELYAQRMLQELQKKGLQTLLISFPEGEKSKTRKTKEIIEDEMISKKCGRDTVLIALGGGVVGDVAGFVAGTYMRGIKYAQYPTTTIAQSDSSFGGKTAIDTPAGKNLIGMFNQPSAVFVDSSTLKTLDEKNYTSGLVEVLKHGLIMDKKLFEFFNKNIKTILVRNGQNYPKVMNTLMRENIKVKKTVVMKDEKEQNLRKILNYGHTVGHAIEKLSNYSLLHGESIAIGLAVEGFIATKTKILSKKEYKKQMDSINTLGLTTQIPFDIPTEQIIDKMKVDKKARNSQAEFSLIKSIGKYASKKGRVAFSFDEQFLKDAIEEYRAKPTQD